MGAKPVSEFGERLRWLVIQGLVVGTASRSGKTSEWVGLALTSAAIDDPGEGRGWRRRRRSTGPTTPGPGRTGQPVEAGSPRSLGAVYKVNFVKPNFVMNWQMPGHVYPPSGDHCPC